MKISKRTLDILKNFSTINQNILLKEGNVIDTVSICQNIIAKAVVEENFPVECGIYNLNSFLSVISLFDDPSFEFGDKSVHISDKNSHVTYVYANTKNIVSFNKKIKLPDQLVSFKLDEGNLQKVLKASDSMELPDIVVTGNGEVVKLVCVDRKNPSSNNYSIELTSKTDKEFNYVFKREYLKLMNGSYTIDVHALDEKKAMGHFKHMNDLSYYIMVNYEE